jgi:oxalate decarboxylase
MEIVSRRNLLAVTAAGSIVAAAAKAQAQTFGNPDLPPQGAINTRSNPRSITDPGPQSPALASQCAGNTTQPLADGELPVVRKKATEPQQAHANP